MPARILVSEDEPHIADAIAYALATDGFVPAWYSTSAAALEQVRSGGSAIPGPAGVAARACRGLRVASERRARTNGLDTD